MAMQLRRRLSTFAFWAVLLTAFAWLAHATSQPTADERFRPQGEQSAMPLLDASDAAAEYSVVPTAPAAMFADGVSVFAPRGEKLQWPGCAPVLSLTLQAQHIRWQI
jgi:hypothetical protein